MLAGFSFQSRTLGFLPSRARWVFFLLMHAGFSPSLTHIEVFSTLMHSDTHTPHENSSTLGFPPITHAGFSPNSRLLGFLPNHARWVLSPLTNSGFSSCLRSLGLLTTHVRWVFTPTFARRGFLHTHALSPPLPNHARWVFSTLTHAVFSPDSCLLGFLPNYARWVFSPFTHVGFSPPLRHV